MKQISTKLYYFILFCLTANSTLFATYYKSVADGDWTNNNTTVWMRSNDGGVTFVATSGTQKPGTSDTAIINNNVTYAATSSAKTLTIAAGGKLTSTSATSAPITLRIGGLLTNNGTLGGPGGDGISLELNTGITNMTITGTGTTQIARVRANVNSGGVIVIDQNMILTYPGVALLGYLNNATSLSTDNVTITINAGKTVTLSSPSGVFHSSSSANQTASGSPATYANNDAGTYIYNINGTLDLSASTATSYMTPLTTSGTSSVTLNVTGSLKLGTGFSTVYSANAATSGPTTLGTVALNISSGGFVDASATTTLTTGSLPFVTAGSSYLKRTVGASDINFPVGTTNTDFNPAILNNSGVSDAFSVSVKVGFDVPPSQTARVNKQWSITEGTPGGSSAIVKLGWLTTDQVGSFNPASAVVILHYNTTTSTYDQISATVSGSGTPADPYYATSNVPVLTFSPFGVANSSALPVKFTAINAIETSGKIKVTWNTATEANISRYVIERSSNGTSFEEVATLYATQSSAYTWVDNAPLPGNNLYRIKAVDKDGSILYTNIVKIAMGKKMAELTIAPNPVKGRIINLQLNNFEQGKYDVSLINSQGQQVFSGLVNHAGGSATQSLQLPSTVKAGVYTLRMHNGSDITNRNVVVE